MSDFSSEDEYDEDEYELSFVELELLGYPLRSVPGFLIAVAMLFIIIFAVYILLNSWLLMGSLVALFVLEFLLLFTNRNGFLQFSFQESEPRDDEEYAGTLRFHVLGIRKALQHRLSNQQD